MQAVPVNFGQSQLSVMEVSAKIIAKLARQQGILAWFALIFGLESFPTGLIASAEEVSDPLVAVLPVYHSLLHEFHDVFDPLGAPSLQQVAKYIDLIDKSVPVPYHRAYCMFPSELAESRY